MHSEDAKERILRCLHATAAAAGHEPRHVFWRLRHSPDALRLECSDEAVLRRLVTAAGAECADVPLRGVLLPEPAQSRTRAWVLASVADVRRSPSHQAEQTTQALQGEVLDVLLHESGWLLVRCADRYLGWMRDWHTSLDAPAVPEGFARRANARIAWPLVTYRQAPGGVPCGESPLGTMVVRGETRQEWCAIELPGGRRGWVPAAALRDGTALWTASAPSVLDMLRSFLGIPYVWGGKSPKGFDCSGLVQFVYALHGIDLPRDSDQQSQAGHAVDSLAPGDLLFFGRERIDHVAVCLGGREFIHARGEVRCNALEAGSPLYTPELASLFRGGRRVLPQPL